MASPSAREALPADTYATDATDEEWGIRIQDKSYWEERYQREHAENSGSFEWYGGYNTVSDLLLEYVPKGCDIIELGCGNSSMSVEMWEDGYSEGSVTAMDFAGSVIKQLNAQYKEMVEKSDNRLRFVEADARRLVAAKEFAAKSVDAVIDKATSDAMLSGPTGLDDIYAVAQSVNEVLRDSGTFFIISHIDPTEDMSWVSDGILPGLRYKDAEKSIWRLEIHSSGEEESAPHCYAFCKRPRRVTRSQTRGEECEVVVKHFIH